MKNLTVLAVLAAAAAAVAGNTYYVDGAKAVSGDGSSWSQAFKTIQEGIDACTDGNGDLVLVTNGTYALTASINASRASMTLRSVNLHAAVIDGGGTVRCIDSSTKTNVTIERFTIRNGYSATWGGGVYGTNKSTVIRECYIVTNVAVNGGGGVYGCTAYDSLIESNAVSNPINTSGYGGAGANSSDLYNCVLRFNTNNASVGGTSALSGGGGAYNCNLIQCTVVSNQARYGGGVYLQASNYAHNCKIERNYAYLNGGGVFLAGNGARLRNCVIAGNYVNQNFGGGVYRRDTSSSLVENCTIVRNQANSSAGGVYAYAGNIVVLNSIVYFNDSVSGNDNWDPTGSSGGTVSMTNSCATLPSPPGGQGNTESNPAFITTNAGTGYGSTWSGANLNLDPAVPSPCIDAGLDQTWMDSSAKDLAGNPRISGARVDMGAYEYYVATAPKRGTLLMIR